MDGNTLQRCFVNLVHSMAMESMQGGQPRFKSQAEFAKAAFPNEPNPVKAWQSVRLGQKGKPRSVSIEEAFTMAQAIDETVDRLLVKSEMLIKDGWNLSNDIFASQDAKQPGRPAKAEKNANHIADQNSAMGTASGTRQSLQS